MRYLRISDESAACTEISSVLNLDETATMAKSRSRRIRKETPLTSTTEVEKILQNGDLFHGEFAGNAPHGHGKYLWVDGCMYEGEWCRGKAFGKGKFSWPSGATYEGEFKKGRMEGFGTFIGADGDTYRGSWIADRKHGNGTKFYVNGDFYEGEWRGNVQDGYGVYVWRNGNRFMGEWRGGVISGRGVFVWCNGNRYEGFWEIGIPKGGGVFTKLNPNFEGKIDVRFDYRESFGEKNFPRICIWESDDEDGDITCEIVDKLDGSVIYNDCSEFAVGDDLRKMRIRNSCFFDSGFVKKPGQIISKGHRNYDLMLKVQIGIRYSVGKLSSGEIRELKTSDFDSKEKFWTRFPPEGSKITPPHQSGDFKWKDYCPLVFRHLRKLFSVHPTDYMISLCGNEALRELSSPGKSGSLFYLTQDDRFIIKTVKKNEVKVLIKMLSSYYQHVRKYGNSLLTKFYGVHCVKPIGCQKVRFIVMGNLFCSEYRIHRRFDLKGSSHGRTIHKAEEEIDETATLKDLDLNFVFYIKRPWHKKFIRQIEQDCEFLVAEGIMDYSLLVGLHFIDDGYNSDMGTSAHSLKSQWRDAARVDGLESRWRHTAKVDGRKPPIHLGANLLARAEHVDHENNLPSGKIYEVILYLGTIDILQDYDFSKKIEHAYKSLQVDSTSISAVDPKLYSKRFRDFISRVFLEDDG